MNLFWLVFTLGWIVCGFLAYGLTKGWIREMLDREILCDLYAHSTKSLPIVHWILGPIGLMIAVFFSGVTEVWGFCLRMPQRLLEVHARLTERR